MNPNENNPISPAGAGDGAAGATPYGGVTSTPGSEAGASTGSSVAAPVDFTNLGSSNNGLSMSDSLASAQDNLTSAGQAANVSAHAPEINQLGADKPAAEMDSPNQPLTPAAPLPGSLGSVSSGAPVGAADTASAAPAMGAADNANSAMPTMGATAAAPTPAVEAASAPAAQPYYNPFASTAAPAASSASASVPPVLQPQAGNFKNMAAKPGKGRSMSSLLAWIVAVVLAGTTALFAILWQMAENKPPEIKYVDRPVENVGDKDDSETGGKSAISCTQEQTETFVEGIGVVPSISRTMNGMFNSDGELSDIALIENYTLADADAEAAAIAYLDAESSRLSTRAAELGIDQMATSFGVSDLAAIFTKSANTAQLDGGFANEFFLETGQDGSVDKSSAAVRQAYENAGFVCEAKSLEN